MSRLLPTYPNSEDRWWDRIREYNIQGILSDRRDPKLGFYTVQELFQQSWKKVKP